MAYESVLDQGPWEVRGHSLQSDDFSFDAALVLDGDFSSEAQRQDYLQNLAQILTRGCALQRALDDELAGGLLHALEASVRAPHGPLLQRAAEEISLLREELALACAMLEQDRFPALRVKRAKAVLAGGTAFANALSQALRNAS